MVGGGQTATALAVPICTDLRFYTALEPRVQPRRADRLGAAVSAKGRRTKRRAIL